MIFKRKTMNKADVFDAFDDAVTTGDWHKFKDLMHANSKLVNAMNKGHLPLLHQAAVKAPEEVVELLTSLGADLGAREPHRGETALHNPSIPTIIFLLLIRKGGDVNARDVFGITPLHSAVLRDDVEKATILLDHGADINAIDFNEQTPLDCTKSGEMIQLLRAHGALLFRNTASGKLQRRLLYREMGRAKRKDNRQI